MQLKHMIKIVYKSGISKRHILETEIQENGKTNYTNQAKKEKLVQLHPRAKQILRKKTTWKEMFHNDKQQEDANNSSSLNKPQFSKCLKQKLKVHAQEFRIKVDLIDKYRKF